MFLMWIPSKDASSENYHISEQRSRVLDSLKSVYREPLANSTYKPKVGACFFSIKMFKDSLKLCCDVNIKNLHCF